MKSSGITAAFAAVVFVVTAPGCEKPVSVDKGKSPKQQNDELPEIPDSPPFAKAVFDKTEYNFGVMEAGEEGHHTFTVINKSPDRPLVLKKGKTTCKCTLSDLPNGTLQPGESTKIKLSWTIPQGAEEFSQTAKIHTSDPENRTVVLSIVGQVRSAIEIMPPDEWRVGTVEDGEPSKYSGYIVSGIFDKFKIVEIVPSSKNITATYRPIKADDQLPSKQRSGYKVELSVKAEGLVGSLRESITIKTELPDKKSGGVRKADFKVRVVGSITGAVQFLALPGVDWNKNAMLARLGQFDSAKGKSATVLMFITEPGDKPFEITKVTSDPPFLKVKLERVGERKKNPENGERSQFRLTLSVPPNSPPVSRLQRNFGTILLETNHPKAKSMKLGLEFHSN